MCRTESPYLSSQLASYFIPAPYSTPLPTSKDCSLGWWGSWGQPEHKAGRGKGTWPHGGVFQPHGASLTESGEKPDGVASLVLRTQREPPAETHHTCSSVKIKIYSER